MKKHLLISSLMLGMVLSLPTAASAGVIKIASVAPMTGPLTQYGDMTRQGVLTAIEMYNAKGGIHGNTFELVSVDDACEPKQGPIAANSVINQKISFVIGPLCSGVTLGAAPIFDEQGVVMITPAATSPSVTEGKNYQYVFRTIGRDDQQGEVAAQFIAKLKPKKIAILHDKQTYGQGIAASTRDHLEKLGVKVDVFEGINPGEADYTPVLTKLKSMGIDFLYYGGYHPELGLLLRQSREQGFNAQFMGPEAAASSELSSIAGSAVEGMLFSLPADFASKPENQAVVKAFKDSGRDPSGAFHLTSYAAMQALATALQETNSTDPNVVAEWLHTHHVNSVIGDLSWAKSGDLTSFAFEIFKWHKDGTKTSAK